ncbi:hypothetical protein JV173_02920 [Acholeplasma equirhinis]|uniref:hypothetical protein n=1 Tax=Acholeplasma equirhinis TaxID=555393 RepID=UPI00197AEBC1|nr:hypothetical protein [Acholeplasma equirhinis]MBN3490461.1 hypothetical protein [Acholeplasma equirhinis]
MKSLLSTLKSFAESQLGLVVVIVMAVIQLSLFNALLTMNFTFNVSVLGGWLSTLVVGFAIIWAQWKGKVLLSHLLLALLFADALRNFVVALIGLNFGAAFDLQLLLSLVSFLYTGLVVLAELMLGKTTAAKIQKEDLLPLAIFAAAVYFSAGWSLVLLSLIPVVIALLLGSRVVAFLFAAATALGSTLGYVNAIMVDATMLSNYLLLALFIVALIFLVMPLMKAIQNQEA